MTAAGVEGAARSASWCLWAHAIVSYPVRRTASGCGGFHGGPDHPEWSRRCAAAETRAIFFGVPKIWT